MIAESQITKELKKLDRLYSKSIVKGDQKIYSKMAIIECCGWVEQTMDKLTLFIKRTIKKDFNRKYLEEKVEKNNSFSYEHFRQILIYAYGIRLLEKIEESIDNIEEFKSTLRTLKKMRDNCAHTYIHGIQQTFNAPSVIISHYIIVLKYLKFYEIQIKRLNS
ncbi:MAG: endoribonuclease [Patescibacteria group bacterium]|jgi:hypothetical protein